MKTSYTRRFAKMQCLFLILFAAGVSGQNAKITGAEKIGNTAVKINLSGGKAFYIDFYAENIFRIFQDRSGGTFRNLNATPPAEILVKEARQKISAVKILQSTATTEVAAARAKIIFDNATGTFAVFGESKAPVLQEKSVDFEEDKTVLKLEENPSEYFYGGGVQNGRFSHKGQKINIKNENSWTDLGVSSPAPFYWSTNGYAVLWHTFSPGVYDFGAREKGTVSLYHSSDYLDIFIMVNRSAGNLLSDYYSLTGKPVLLPKFGFFEGHLNAYNRDFWKEDPAGILFEDGKRYKESQKDNGGIKESLNGEKNNYQFSARAVIDRYRRNDMPLGWILPNDGYGAGYGQENTLDGNILNLKKFGDFAQKNNVKIGLWTQSDLHPKPNTDALLQRDIVKEVGEAGVRVLKTDVAWVGAGYSFGLNGVADAAEVITKYGNNARPFIISLDGWAGTQRYAAVWTGDQTGGNWQYIRFHIPTYIGAGLSGQPNITSDMDGIFGGKNPLVNTRDFQWKTFTPIQLNMDGWGSTEKYPQAQGEPYTSVNRDYLKLKSVLLPYAYSAAAEAREGLPLIRPVFTEDANDFTLGKNTEYEFLYGPYLLVAPIYQNTKADKDGNDIRNNIWLPKGLWYDYFTGEAYTGGQLVNTFPAPFWKLPVLVKSGAVIPMANPANNPAEINQNHRIFEIYPGEKTSFTLYDDDGASTAYQSGAFTKTKITAELKKQVEEIFVDKTSGSYEGFTAEKSSEFIINVTKMPEKIMANAGGKNIALRRVESREDYDKSENVFYYDSAPDLNLFATRGSDFAKIKMTKNPQLRLKTVKINVKENSLHIKITGCEFAPKNNLLAKTGSLTAPEAAATAENTGPYSIKATWKAVPAADFYEIFFNGVVYGTIRDTEFAIENLQPETVYDFKIRSVNKGGASDWAKFSAKTKDNPYEFLITGTAATATVQEESDMPISMLTDGNIGSLWFTDYNKKAVPFDIILDLKSTNTVDKLQYVPRDSGFTGMWLSGKIAYSESPGDWKPEGSFTFAQDNTVKTFEFKDKPVARYLKISVEKTVRDLGSGQELMVYKVPGTESYFPGDINNDKKVDENDLVSYLNYTGLQKGDADFDGYVSMGDINGNGLIDAFDIASAFAEIKGNPVSKDAKAEGKAVFKTDKNSYAAGETVRLTVSGENLRSANAISMEIPYSSADLEFVSVKPIATGFMENFSKDRLHTNGQKAVYPTFVNETTAPALSGNKDLFTVIFKAKRNFTPNFKLQKLIIADKNLNVAGEK